MPFHAPKTLSPSKQKALPIKYFVVFPRKHPRVNGALIICWLLLTGERARSYVMPTCLSRIMNVRTCLQEALLALSEDVLVPTFPVNPSVEAQEQDEIRAPDDGVLRARLDNPERHICWNTF